MVKYTDEECREVLDRLNKLTESFKVRQPIHSLLFTAAEIIEERLEPQAIYKFPFGHCNACGMPHKCDTAALTEPEL